MRRALMALASLGALVLAPNAWAVPAGCPGSGPMFVIRDANRSGEPDAARHLAFVRTFMRGVQTENALVILGPDVELDFSVLPSTEFAFYDAEERAPVRAMNVARCVRITSVADLATVPMPVGAQTAPPPAAPPTYTFNRAALPGARAPSAGASARAGTTNTGAATTGATQAPDVTESTLTWDASWADSLVEARSARQLGPIVRYGPSRGRTVTSLFAINCRFGENDHVRISGFRLLGPSFEAQSSNERGIDAVRCTDIEISNMEVAGWGGIGIGISDRVAQDLSLQGRINAPDEIRIHGNWIHHNQHPETTVATGPCVTVRSLWGAGTYPGAPAPMQICPTESGALGYGVSAGGGAWAHIYENVFDFNRHAIAAGWDIGGYDVEHNLILKGGGVHTAHHHTHQVDVHGSGCVWSEDLCGTAGEQIWVRGNAFQYVEGPAIEIRGRVRIGAEISNNRFPHERLMNVYHTMGAYDALINPAISLNQDEGVTIANNATSHDTFGQYGVCDFDADGVDDLFQATGVSWWFSSMGERAWTFLAAARQGLSRVRLGEFDRVRGCDVMVESGSGWVLFSGGRGPPVRLGQFGVPLSDVAFGRFGERPARGRIEMMAFRRDASGDWSVTELDEPNGWHAINNSGAPFDQLRFADVTGDGRTDVLAIANGHWSYSNAGVSGWTDLNTAIATPMGELFFADLDANGRMDLIKLDQSWRQDGSTWVGTLHWRVSADGRSAWRDLGAPYVWTYVGSSRPRAPAAFAGNFGVARGGGVMLIDAARLGRFRAPGEARSDWTSAVSY